MRYKTNLFLSFLGLLGLFVQLVADEELDQVKDLFMEGVQVEVERIDPETLDPVLQHPVYRLQIQLFPVESIYRRTGSPVVYQDEGGALAQIFTPSTNEKLPWLEHLLDPEFRLSEETAPQLESALRAFLPERFFEEDEDILRELSGEWRILTGTFFDNLKGFIFKVDDEGRITEASYSLDLGPAEE